MIEQLLIRKLIHLIITISIWRFPPYTFLFDGIDMRSSQSTSSRKSRLWPISNLYIINNSNPNYFLFLLKQFSWNLEIQIILLKREWNSAKTSSEFSINCLKILKILPIHKIWQILLKLPIHPVRPLFPEQNRTSYILQLCDSFSPNWQNLF